PRDDHGPARAIPSQRPGPFARGVFPRVRGRPPPRRRPARPALVARRRRAAPGPGGVAQGRSARGRPQPDQARAARRLPPPAPASGAWRLRGRGPSGRGARRQRAAPAGVPAPAAQGRRIAGPGPRRHNAGASSFRFSLRFLAGPSLRLSLPALMNQTRVFLILAWLMVAVLLWMEWGKEQAAPPASASAPTTAVAEEAVPQPVAAVPADGSVPAATAPAPAVAATPAAASAQRVTVSSDVLRLVLDGGSVVQADLLQFPRSRTGDGTPVRLFDADPTHF